jgi:hypothetical protein
LIYHYHLYSCLISRTQENIIHLSSSLFVKQLLNSCGIDLHFSFHSLLTIFYCNEIYCIWNQTIELILVWSFPLLSRHKCTKIPTSFRHLVLSRHTLEHSLAGMSTIIIQIWLYMCSKICLRGAGKGVLRIKTTKIENRTSE